MLGVPACVLDEFAERLARDIDAGEQLESGRRPGRDAAVENGDVRVAVVRENRGRAVRRGRRRRRTARCAFARRGTSCANLNSNRLSGTERASSRWLCEKIKLLAHVDQRDFAAVGEHAAKLLRADRTRAADRSPGSRVKRLAW